MARAMMTMTEEDLVDPTAEVLEGTYIHLKCYVKAVNAQEIDF